MDSSVIRRLISLGVPVRYAKKIGIFELTEKPHSNFNDVKLRMR
ncbi:MAG: hypothetical protein ACOYJD_01685 [Christensenellales bacterium]